MDRHTYERSGDECLQESVITAVHKTVKVKKKKHCLTYLKRTEIDSGTYPSPCKRATHPC